MIIVMKPNASEKNIQTIIKYIEGNGLQAHLSKGTEVTIIGIVGDKSKIATENIMIYEDVQKIVPVTETYKLSNKQFHPEPSVIPVGTTVIGPHTLTIMAGPCAVESKEQLLSIAHAVKASGATILRGGAYKPRTSPYAFQGLEEEGL
ncbi:MAG: 3-deoxy-7-phosphoheptulonate synthase, partial [Lachnospiraceae bacterium]